MMNLTKDAKRRLDRTKPVHIGQKNAEKLALLHILFAIGGLRSASEQSLGLVSGSRGDGLYPQSRG